LGWGEWVGGWEPVNPTVWWAGKTQVEYPFGQLGGGPRPKIFLKNNSLKARKAETMGDESHFCIPFDTKLWKNLRENILSLILQFWHILFSSCKSILDDNVLVISCLLAKDWAKPHRLFGNNGNPLQYPGTLKKTVSNSCLVKQPFFTRNHPIETTGNKWMFQVPGINLLR